MEMEYLSKIYVHKSMGSDEMPLTVLRNLADVIARPL